MFEETDSFDMANFIRDGRICRIDELGPFVRRVAIQFSEPLPFNPAAGQHEETLMCV
jgi:hypothetical protein